MKPFERDPDDQRSAKERMLAGDWYIADDPALQEAYRTALTTTARFNEAYVSDPDGAQVILQGLFGELGEGSHVRAPLRVDYGTQIHIGPGTFVNYGLVALDVVEIRIGANCQLANDIQLLTPIHPLDPQPRREGWEAGEPITIGGNVWIGGGVIVLPGVTIGEDAVVGAGSVVTKDVPARTVVAGNPARVIREL